MLVDGVGGALADIVDNRTCFLKASKLYEGLGTHQHHVCETEHVVVHRESLP